MAWGACGPAAGTERPERTARGYRRFRCRECGKQYNERSGDVLKSYDELRDFLRLRKHHNQHVPASRRRLLHLRRATSTLAILEAA